MNKLFLIAVCFLLSNTAHPAGGAPDVEGALKDTKALLQDPNRRNDLIQRDANARAADDRVKNLTSGNEAQTQAIYDASSSAFSSLMQSADNNPDKALELLQNAQNNPEEFYKNLPADVRNQIKDVSRDIEKQNSRKNNP